MVQWLGLRALTAEGPSLNPGLVGELKSHKPRSTDKKKKEVLIHATAWMNLEIVMLSERSQSQR